MLHKIHDEVICIHNARKITSIEKFTNQEGVKCPIKEVV